MDRKITLGAEEAAASISKGKLMVELLDEVRADKKLSAAAKWDDSNQIRDCILEVEGSVRYASRRSPEPRMDIISRYKPKHPQIAKDSIVEKDPWDGIFARVLHDDDDGPAAKLVRALAHGENICAAYSMNDPLLRIKGDMWLQLGHMAIDSVEDTGDVWVRSAGFPEAWEK
ncbi:MAG: hypothetical protein ASARMPREDX12_003927 [Alectoria sarmentosa]|nr:MAG: hypothetical protein ASARMPREDX12_003927 [Alectoria sarmentosa]